MLYTCGTIGSVLYIWQHLHLIPVCPNTLKTMITPYMLCIDVTLVEQILACHQTATLHFNTKSFPLDQWIHIHRKQDISLDQWDQIHRKQDISFRSLGTNT